jgi:hypothetical protein
VAFGVDMTLIEFLFMVCVLALIVLAWVIIDYQRRTLDALHTLIAQGSARRQWARGEREL